MHYCISCACVIIIIRGSLPVDLLPRNVREDYVSPATGPLFAQRVFHARSVVLRYGRRQNVTYERFRPYIIIVVVVVVVAIIMARDERKSIVDNEKPPRVEVYSHVSVSFFFFVFGRL